MIKVRKQLRIARVKLTFRLRCYGRNHTALYDIGSVLGSIVCYFVGERLGRRAMLMMGGAIMIVGCAILGSSYARDRAAHGGPRRHWIWKRQELVHDSSLP